MTSGAVRPTPRKFSPDTTVFQLDHRGETMVLRRPISPVGCAGNGGEGGDLSQATVFEINSPLVPLRNIQCSDCGDAFPEELGANLTDWPAWLR